MQLLHSQLKGMASTMAGIMSAMGNDLILVIRRPVATIRKPPQALKSAIMSGVVMGRMPLAPKNRARKITSWGSATSETT